jgi:DNA-binding transcriptional ArsR family regulator
LSLCVLKQSSPLPAAVRQDTCLTGSLVDLLPIVQSTVSEHLRILRTAGLISGEVDWPRRVTASTRKAWTRHGGCCKNCGFLK